MPHETIREHLIEELRTLTARQNIIGAHLRNADRAMPDDWGERATFIENDEVLEALDDHGRARLAILQAALVRIEDGSWGRCAACGEDINPRRLAAMPETERCIDCATANEHGA